MSSELYTQFSAELKSAREKKKISLQQISNKTRINIKFLEAIEEGNFGIIDEIYLRAFITEYCQMVELDPVEVLSKFDKCKTGKVEKDDADPYKENGNAKKSPIKKNDSTYILNILNYFKNIKSNIILISGIIAAVLIIFFTVYFLFIRESVPKIITEKPYEEIIEEQSKKYEITQEQQSNAQVYSVDSLLLRITTTDTSWIRVAMDGSRVQEFILFPAREKLLKASREFNILFGNTGGIELFLNGNSLNFVGRRGEVKNIIVDRNGYRSMVINEPSQNE